jgi:hypothetical protein
LFSAPERHSDTCEDEKRAEKIQHPTKLSGSQPLEILARVAAGVREPDRAIAALQKLLSMPGDGALAENVPLTPALLRLDPRFQKLAASEGRK